MRPGCKIKLKTTTILLGRTLARLKSRAQDKPKSQVAKLQRQTVQGDEGAATKVGAACPGWGAGGRIGRGVRAARGSGGGSGGGGGKS
eukprot:416150-Rhodomonas_salina.1